MPSLPELLARYAPRDDDETAMAARLRSFLAGLPEPQAAFERELAGAAPAWGHVTGSAWVVNNDLTRAVLVHHAKLGIWVQPGGHCDGESDVLAVACREAREETGLNVTPLSEEIFDMDVHRIPAYWNTPEHWHYDVRFLLQATTRDAPVASAESHAVRWVTLDEAAALNGTASITRLIAKTRQLMRG
jgi:8-oxo-dGTP pyrophosphatase MutT (NUDIX family)